MGIGSTARKWLASKHGHTNNKTYTSKYYLPEESWPKVAVWWMKIPAHALEPSKYDFVNILCQVDPLSNEFYYLKVPVSFINEHKEQFHRIGGEIDLYLSAEEHNLFTEIRGEGKLDFSKFIVDAKAV
jgi:hypothetical protein